MLQFPLWNISALVLIFPPETLHLIDFSCITEEYVEALLILLAHWWHSLLSEELNPLNMTASFQWDRLDKLAALVLFKLPSRWHCHSDSACLLCKGVSFLNHLNMVCGYTTSNHTQQRNAHAHMNTRSHSHEFLTSDASGSESNKCWMANKWFYFPFIQ